MPEPALGINFARDGMERRDWLALVAVHSDAWLMATAFFYAVRLDAVGRCVLQVFAARRWPQLPWRVQLPLCAVMPVSGSVVWCCVSLQRAL